MEVQFIHNAQMQLHDKQKSIVKSNARFKVIRAGRRSGKTTLQVENMTHTAVSKSGRNIFYLAPTQKQARSIVWQALLSRLAGIGQANESRLEMKVPTIDGGFSYIYISGWENRENFRGLKADLIVFDELDTMKEFFIGWQEIFRPALTDTGGKAVFIGTPKKENPNLRRLEKMAETDSDYATFQFSTYDNPHIPREELEKAKKEVDQNTFRQEYLAEYVDNEGALFRYASLVDVFTNTVSKTGNKYMIIDVADDGTDKTVFSLWEDLEEYHREEYHNLNSEGVVMKTRELASQNKIPYSHIAVDAIGVGSSVASSSLLTGIVGYKSSFAPIKTDMDIVKLPSVGYLPDAKALTSDFRNLRSQCVFTLADYVNNHNIASRVTGRFKEHIIEELSTYQDASTGDGKRMATQKEDVKEILGRSPDHSDTWIMRMYFVIRDNVVPEKQINTKLQEVFERNAVSQEMNSCK